MLTKSDLDLDRIVTWKKPDEALEELELLIKKPPLRSVVVKIYPAVAQAILSAYNTQNRSLKKGLERSLGLVVQNEVFELTGDTIKMSKNGVLLDGQHRLKSCAISSVPIMSHMVFGLRDEVFDVLDQGYKRTPADVLKLRGIRDATWIASSIRWVVSLETGTIASRSREALSPRDIRELAEGRLKDLHDYVPAGRLINEAFGHPPSLITALAFVIGKRNEKLAKDFIHEWVHGARVGRNENFDTLNLRLMTLQKQSGGRVNSYVRAALIIQMFNAWNANTVVTARALSWRLQLPFPKLEFDAVQYLKKREMYDGSAIEDITENQRKVLGALKAARDSNSLVQITFSQLSKQSDVRRGSIPFVLNSLEEKQYITLIKPASEAGTSIYRVNPSADAVQT